MQGLKIKIVRGYDKQKLPWLITFESRETGKDIATLQLDTSEIAALAAGIVRLLGRESNPDYREEK